MPILSWLRTDCPGEPKEVLRSVEDVVRFVVLVARSPFLQHQHVVVVVVVVVRSLIRPNYLVSAWLQLDCCNFESDSDCVHVLHVGSRAGAACIRRSETLFSTTPLLPEDNRECRCSCSDSIKKDENAAVHFLTSIVVTDVVVVAVTHALRLHAGGGCDARSSKSPCKSTRWVSNLARCQDQWHRTSRH